MRDTWYVLEDETRVHPDEVAPDENGVLRHKSGAAVAIGSHGNPRTAGVDVDEHGKLLTVPAAPVPGNAPTGPRSPRKADAQMQAAKKPKGSRKKPGYETR